MSRQAFRWASFVVASLLGLACGATDMATPPRDRATGNVVSPAPGGPLAPGTMGTVPLLPGSTGGAAGSGSIDTSAPNVSASPLPCEVATVVATRCHQCHGQSLVGGAPMKLVTAEDFQADHVVKTTAGLIGQSMKVYELARMRLADAAKPMPPGGATLAADKQVLDAWLARGALAGTDADRQCAGATPPEPIDEPPPVVSDPNETCFELHMHGQARAGDTSKYTIRSGEYYSCFFYKLPWNEPSEGVRFGNKFENEAVLHHWLLYTTSQAQQDGAVVDCVGTHIGDTAQLLAGWAVGGLDVTMPDGVGFQLPATGMLLVEWHLYNTTGAAIQDGSGIEVCTVPAGTREHAAALTWLGTENFNGPLGMPAGVMSDFSGTCRPGRQGMNATDPIHIFAFLPHMHKLGRNMRSLVTRVNGMQEEVFNKPFDFNQQIHYEVSVDLFPGDAITSTCTFFNNTPAAVPFGNSSDTEMCYQFAFSYPAGGLTNHVFGLNGANNNCW
jgi:hypothetical protein